jgi:hypothetical protein
MSLWRQRLAFLLILAYAGTGPLVELIHRDVSAVSAGTAAAIATHGCGAKEKHVPLEGIHACVLCVQSAQRSAVTASSDSTPAPLPASPGPVVLATDRTVGPNFVSVPPRGPPAA